MYATPPLVGSRRNTVKSFESAFTSAMSLPGPTPPKFPATMALGSEPVPPTGLLVKWPCPSLRSRNTDSSPPRMTARSWGPFPLKSPTATDDGPSPMVGVDVPVALNGGGHGDAACAEDAPTSASMPAQARAQSPSDRGLPFDRPRRTIEVMAHSSLLDTRSPFSERSSALMLNARRMPAAERGLPYRPSNQFATSSLGITEASVASTS